MMPPVLHRLTAFDHGIVGLYFLFMLGIGWVFRGLSRSTSDYFRCGGAMPWWITGASAWVATFSAWTFVGAASEVYRSGLKVLLLFYAALPALGLVLYVTAVRFRRLRVVSWMEAVRERFGPVSEQFFTWIKVPIELVKAGVYLMSISLFIAAVMRLPVAEIILILGVVITLVSFAGGAFAVLASDFVQMVLVMTITLATVWLTLRRPEIGGLSGLVATVNAAHPGHFRWWLALHPAIILGWGLAFSWVKMAELNSLEYSTMYLMPKNERNARRMVLIPLVGGFIGPLIWIVPPLAATVLFPDLRSVFPNMANPSEGAFVATALSVMPAGLMGLLMCAMFGATLTFMDAALNKYVGVFVRSFYRPILAPDAPDSHLLQVSKVCTLVFGAIIIAISLLVNAHRHSDIFTLLNQLMVSLGFPLTIPIFFGLFYRRTPGWSAWAAATAGFVFSAWANFVYSAQLSNGSLPPAEQSDLLLIVTVIGTTVVGATVFFGSSWFYARSGEADRVRIAAFFARLARPLDETDAAGLSDEPIYRLLGRLCLVFGTFVLLLMLIPNPPSGRACFLLIGVAIAGAGLTLTLVGKRKRQTVAQLAR